MILKKDGQGFVALITTIMISLLLLVMTVSLVAVESIQLRKADDAEQSLRAYYTAEAGVEDAVSQVLSDKITPSLGANQCGTDPGYDPAGDAGWTCQEVTFTGAPTGLLTTPNLATTIAPGKHVGTPYQSVLLEWGQSADTVAGHFNVNLAGGFPSQAGFVAANYAVAPIELSIVQYPDGGFPSSAVCTSVGTPAGCSVTLENAVIVPGGNSVGTVPYSTTNAFTSHGAFQGNCLPNPRTKGYLGQATSYNCYALLTGFTPADDYMFRIRSLYIPSSYKMTFLSASGAVVPVPTGTAIIDVTARSGAEYRRVISELPLNDGAAGGLNYVMYSDTNICKNFEVIDPSQAFPAGYSCP